jgi:hypothetical protein
MCGRTRGLGCMTPEKFNGERSFPVKPVGRVLLHFVDGKVVRIWVDQRIVWETGKE